MPDASPGTAIRCPVNTRRVFAKIRTDPQVSIGPDNAILFSCRDCRSARRAAGEQVRLVVHEFNLLGQLVQTHVYPT